MLGLSGIYTIFGVLFANRTGAFRRAIQYFRQRRISAPTVTIIEPVINDISRTEHRVLFIIKFQIPNWTLKTQLPNGNEILTIVTDLNIMFPILNYNTYK